MTYDLFEAYLLMTESYRGFDAQINGAMISVASFRRDFGYALPLIDHRDHG